MQNNNFLDTLTAADECDRILRLFKMDPPQLKQQQQPPPNQSQSMWSSFVKTVAPAAVSFNMPWSNPNRAEITKQLRDATETTIKLLSSLQKPNFHAWMEYSKNAADQLRNSVMSTFARKPTIISTGFADKDEHIDSNNIEKAYINPVEQQNEYPQTAAQVVPFTDVSVKQLSNDSTGPYVVANEINPPQYSPSIVHATEERLSRRGQTPPEPIHNKQLSPPAQTNATPLQSNNNDWVTENTIKSMPKHETINPRNVSIGNASITTNPMHQSLPGNTSESPPAQPQTQQTPKKTLKEHVTNYASRAYNAANRHFTRAANHVTSTLNGNRTRRNANSQQSQRESQNSASSVALSAATSVRNPMISSSLASSAPSSASSSESSHRSNSGYEFLASSASSWTDSENDRLLPQHIERSIRDTQPNANKTAAAPNPLNKTTVTPNTTHPLKSNTPPTTQPTQKTSPLTNTLKRSSPTKTRKNRAFLNLNQPRTRTRTPTESSPIGVEMKELTLPSSYTVNLLDLQSQPLNQTTTIKTPSPTSLTQTPTTNKTPSPTSLTQTQTTIKTPSPTSLTQTQTTNKTPSPTSLTQTQTTNKTPSPTSLTQTQTTNKTPSPSPTTNKTSLLSPQTSAQTQNQNQIPSDNKNRQNAITDIIKKYEGNIKNNTAKKTFNLDEIKARNIANKQYLDSKKPTIGGRHTRKSNHKCKIVTKKMR